MGFYIFLINLKVAWQEWPCNGKRQPKGNVIMKGLLLIKRYCVHQSVCYDHRNYGNNISLTVHHRVIRKFNTAASVFRLKIMRSRILLRHLYKHIYIYNFLFAYRCFFNPPKLHFNLHFNLTHLDIVKI